MANQNTGEYVDKIRSRWAGLAFTSFPKIIMDFSRYHSFHIPLFQAFGEFAHVAPCAWSSNGRYTWGQRQPRQGGEKPVFVRFSSTRLMRSTNNCLFAGWGGGRRWPWQERQHEADGPGQGGWQRVWRGEIGEFDIRLAKRCLVFEPSSHS